MLFPGPIRNLSNPPLGFAWICDLSASVLFRITGGQQIFLMARTPRVQSLCFISVMVVGRNLNKWEHLELQDCQLNSFN